MNKYFISFFMALAILCISMQVFARSEINGKVIRVADGDTITVLTPDYQQYKVRLYGIDALERKMPYGRRSGQALSGMVAGKDVRVKILDTDRYGRSVGLVFKDGDDVNRQMVREGWAWVYDHYCKAAFCMEWKIDEAQAKMNKRGLWQDPNPVEPWTWRKSNRR